MSSILLFSLSEAVCPNGWFHIHDSCYKFSTANALSWDAAKLSCEAMSSHLLIVNSDSEQLAVAGAIKRTSNMWIGLRRDDSNKNQWIWVDGQKVTYSNWGVGEPNNINEECVVMNTSPTGKWYDDRCSERRPFICEKEGTSENLCLYESSASAKGH